MKAIINKLAVLLLAAFALSACNEHTEYDDTGFSAVETLLYPSDGYSLDLIDQADASLYFEWEVSKTGTPVYTVVFTDANGEEVGRYLSDNSGKRATLDMPHSTLNSIAAEAGIAIGATGEIRWTVCAGLGNAEKLSDAAPHKLYVKRYNKTEAPYRLYVTGEGSEFGADPANAQEMRNLGDGRFEIYTKLSGTYSFINRNEAGNKRTFGVSETEAGVLAEGDEASDSGNGVYRIVVDFNALTVTKEQITDVILLRAGTNYDGTPLATFEYDSNGAWRADDFRVPTDGDDRYRFCAKVDGEYEVWGSKDGRDASDPGQIEGGSYFNIYIHSGEEIRDDSYARIWKFYSQLKGLEVSVLVHMSPDADNYYHSFDVGFEPVAQPVSTLLAPAADASVELNAQAGAKISFSWEKLSGSTPDVQLTTYSLVFFSDAALTSEVSRVSVGANGSADVTYTQLEQIAGSAGIAAEGTGDLYWAVESSLLGSTVLSDGRKLTVTRMKGIPTVAYISGDASEYGSGSKALKSLGGGKFEIYTKLTRGTYYVTDSNDAEARYFSVTGGAISEGAAGSGNTSSEEAIYRITLDFASGTSTFEKITDVKYDFKMSGHVVDLPYQGDGVWGKNNFSATNGGNDTRYYLYMSFDGKQMRLGNKNPDYASADPNSFSEEGDSNFYVYLMEEPSDQWSYYFKFPGSYRGTQNTISVKLNMSSDVENYYTYVTDQTIF